MFHAANYKYNLPLKFVFSCYNFYINEGNIEHLGPNVITYLRNFRKVFNICKWHILYKKTWSKIWVSKVYLISAQIIEFVFHEVMTNNLHT